MIEKFSQGSKVAHPREFLLLQTSSPMSIVYYYKDNLHHDHRNKLLQTSLSPVNQKIKMSRIKNGSKYLQSSPIIPIQIFETTIKIIYSN